jgi:hypothetical protein
MECVVHNPFGLVLFNITIANLHQDMMLDSCRSEVDTESTIIIFLAISLITGVLILFTTAYHYNSKPAIKYRYLIKLVLRYRFEIRYRVIDKGIQGSDQVVLKVTPFSHVILASAWVSTLNQNTGSLICFSHLLVVLQPKQGQYRINSITL